MVMDVAEKENIKTDIGKKQVILNLNPRLYPQTVVMRASYRFIDSFDVIVEGDPLSDIVANIQN